MKRIFALIPLLVMALSGCETLFPAQLEIYTASLQFGDSKEKLFLEFNTNREWKASVSEDWCTLGRLAGLGSKDIQTFWASCDSNESFEPRECVITLTCGESDEIVKTIKVFQQEKTGLVAGEYTYKLTSAAQSVKINVSSNRTYDVMVVDQEASSWIRRSTTKGFDESIVILDIDANVTDIERSGSVTIRAEDGEAEIRIEIIQDEKAAIILSAKQMEINGDRQTMAVKIRTNIDDIVADTGQYDWIAFSPTRSIEEREISFTIAENPSFEQPRSGEIIFRNKEFGLEEHLVIIQERRIVFDTGDRLITLLSMAQTFTIEGSSSQGIEFSVNDDCRSWLRQVETRAAEPFAYTFEVTENEGEINRTGHITATGREGAKRTIEVTQMCSEGKSYRILYSGCDFPELSITPDSGMPCYLAVKYDDGHYIVGPTIPHHHFANDGNHTVMIFCSGGSITFPIEGISNIEILGSDL